MFRYLERSASAIKETSAKVIKADFLNRQTEHVVATVSSKDDLSKWITGSDKDI
ncbi:hypothetical protein GGI10_005954, partial [Coemansia sp. RSA 2530]